MLSEWIACAGTRYAATRIDQNNNVATQQAFLCAIFFFVLLRNHKSWCDGGSHRSCIEHNFCLLHNKCFSKLIWVFCSHTVSRRYLIAENFECSIGYLRFSLKRSMMNPSRYLNLAIKHTRFGLFTLPWRNGAEIMCITFVTIHSKIACECEFLTYDIRIH